MSFKRPDQTEYYLELAKTVRERANCKGSRVGAVLVLNDRVISTGYNGVPQGMTNCDEGGCDRCSNRDRKYTSGTAYDICICVHAEANALLTAARFGIAVEGAVLYTTTRPCFGCAKELLQAHVMNVFYIHEWTRPTENPDLAREYRKLLSEFKSIDQVPIFDLQQEWAKGGSRVGGFESGAHQKPTAHEPKSAP